MFCERGDVYAGRMYVVFGRRSVFDCAEPRGGS